MSGPAWRLDYARSARKDLRRLDPPIRTRVVKAIERIAADGTENSGMVKLRGRPDQRLRVGDWRVIVELDTADRAIRVKRVLPRGRAYER